MVCFYTPLIPRKEIFPITMGVNYKIIMIYRTLKEKHFNIKIISQIKINLKSPITIRPGPSKLWIKLIIGYNLLTELLDTLVLNEIEI